MEALAQQQRAAARGGSSTTTGRNNSSALINGEDPNVDDAMYSLNGPRVSKVAAGPSRAPSSSYAAVDPRLAGGSRPRMMGLSRPTPKFVPPIKGSATGNKRLHHTSELPVASLEKVRKAVQPGAAETNPIPVDIVANDEDDPISSGSDEMPMQLSAIGAGSKGKGKTRESGAGKSGGGGWGLEWEEAENGPRKNKPLPTANISPTNKTPRRPPPLNLVRNSTSQTASDSPDPIALRPAKRSPAVAMFHGASKKSAQQRFQRQKVFVDLPEAGNAKQTGDEEVVELSQGLEEGDAGPSDDEELPPLNGPVPSQSKKSAVNGKGKEEVRSQTSSWAERLAKKDKRSNLGQERSPSLGSVIARGTGSLKTPTSPVAPPRKPLSGARRSEVDLPDHASDTDESRDADFEESMIPSTLAPGVRLSKRGSGRIAVESAEEEEEDSSKYVNVGGSLRKMREDRAQGSSGRKTDADYTPKAKAVSKGLADATPRPKPSSARQNGSPIRLHPGWSKNAGDESDDSGAIPDSSPLIGDDSIQFDSESLQKMDQVAEQLTQRSSVDREARVEDTGPTWAPFVPPKEVTRDRPKPKRRPKRPSSPSPPPSSAEAVRSPAKKQKRSKKQRGGEDLGFQDRTAAMRLASSSPSDLPPLDAGPAKLNEVERVPDSPDDVVMLPVPGTQSGDEVAESSPVIEILELEPFKPKLQLSEVKAAAYCKEHTSDKIKCEYCRKPMPKNPSSGLRKLQNRLRAVAKETARPLHWTRYISYCERHEAETSTFPLGIQAGYPKTYDFSRIDERVGESAKLAIGLCEKPRESPFFIVMEREIQVQGKKEWDSVAARNGEQRQERLQPGYYGEIGRRAIYLAFQRHFSAIKPKPEAIAPVSVEDWIQTVVVNEMVIRLIQQDIAPPDARLGDRKRAIQILKQSREYGRRRFAMGSEYDLSARTNPRWEEEMEQAGKRLSGGSGEVVDLT